MKKPETLWNPRGATKAHPRPSLGTPLAMFDQKIAFWAGRNSILHSKGSIFVCSQHKLHAIMWCQSQLRLQGPLPREVASRRAPPTVRWRGRPPPVPTRFTCVGSTPGNATMHVSTIKTSDLGRASLECSPMGVSLIYIPLEKNENISKANGKGDRPFRRATGPKLTSHMLPCVRVYIMCVRACIGCNACTHENIYDVYIYTYVCIYISI